MEFTPSTMTCGHCVRTVTDAIQQLDPNAKVDIDLHSHRLQAQTQVDQFQVCEVWVEVGYEPD